MTIKRQILISNVRTVLVTLFGLFLLVAVIQLVLVGIMGIDLRKERRMQNQMIDEYYNPHGRLQPPRGLPPPVMEELDYEPKGWMRALAPLSFIVFATIISVINNLLNYRLIKNIVRPLEPLSEGVKQIHDNNLAFRIDYRNDDEYRPICEAFNEMAARLHASAARKQKDEANRRELIAGISHDLRTPLTSIKGYLEGLETGVASTPEMRHNYFTIIKNKTGDMEHIIEQLFLFSKLDMDEFPLTMRRVFLMPLISDMIDDSGVSTHEEYGRRGLAVRFTPCRENVEIYADTLWLHNVCGNILENSVRYKTKEKGTVEISCNVVNDSVFLRFADDGPGVPAEALPNLFDVFYRVDPSRSAKGSGLGLAISKKIIERMGGAIYAELPAGGGLAIVVRLPIARDA
jgi:signal transduction histidine kinase